MMWVCVCVCVKTYYYQCQWGEHQFPSYFDVHKGYKVLTQSHVYGVLLAKTIEICFWDQKWVVFELLPTTRLDTDNNEDEQDFLQRAL